MARVEEIANDVWDTDGGNPSELERGNESVS